jgi:cob(I)alamin adenosyltransferase
MGTKNTPGKFDCYANAKPDEPMFVLLGRDPMAADFVRAWAEMRQREGESMEVVNEALDCANAMEKWTREVAKKVPFVIKFINYGRVPR